MYKQKLELITEKSAELCAFEKVELVQKLISKRKISLCMLTGENKTPYIYKMFMFFPPSFVQEIFSSFQ